MVSQSQRQANQSHRRLACQCHTDPTKASQIAPRAKGGCAPIHSRTAGHRGRRWTATGDSGRLHGRGQSRACGRPRAAWSGLWDGAGGCQIALRWAVYGYGAKRRCPLFFGAWGRQLAPRWVVYAVGQTAVPTICRARSFGICLAHVPCEINILIFPGESAGEPVATAVATVVGTQK